MPFHPNLRQMRDLLTEGAQHTGLPRLLGFRIGGSVLNSVMRWLDRCERSYGANLVEPQ